MNVIWIEDFGGNLLAPNAANVMLFFGSILDRSDFPMGWLGNANLKDSPDRLEKQCRDSRSRHVVRLFSDYWRFRDWMESARGPEEADLILIDLNLDDGFSEARPPPDELREHQRLAGLQLFHLLTLRHNFAADKIAFLTANAPDVEAFNNFGRTHHLPPLRYFAKSEAGRLALHQWLETHASEPNTDLRRGIIDGAHHLLNEEELVAKTLSRDDVRMIAETITALLVTGSMLSRRPELIASAFAAPWDSVAWRDRPGVLAGWMKHCRNALAHRHFGQSISLQQLALVALVGFRAMTEWPDQTQPHEALLRGVACRLGNGSGVPHDQVKGRVVESLVLSPAVVADGAAGDRTFRHPNPTKKDKVNEKGSIMDLARFALVSGVQTDIAPFNMYAAGLWESLDRRHRAKVDSPALKAEHIDTTFARVARALF